MDDKLSKQILDDLYRFASYLLFSHRINSKA
jgi:hypothetical protein